MESLVGYVSDDDIPDRRYSNAELQEQNRQDSTGMERSEMDNYDNIQMDMSEDSNSASGESGCSGNPDSHVQPAEETLKKWDGEKRGVQQPGNYCAQGFDERKSYHRDEKHNSTTNHPERLNEEHKFYPAHRDDRKPSIEKRSENNFAGNSNRGDYDNRVPKAERDEDLNKSYEEDRGRRRLEAEEKLGDKYDNSKGARDNRKFEEEKRGDKLNYRSDDKRSGCEKRETKPYADNGRNPRVDKYDDNNKSDRDNKKSSTDIRDSQKKSADRQERRLSLEKREKHKARPEDHDVRNSNRSNSRDKVSDGKRTSRDRDLRKSGRSHSRERAGDAKRLSIEREDKRPRRSKSREKSRLTKCSSHERDEKKSRRSSSKDEKKLRRSGSRDEKKSRRSSSRDDKKLRRSSSRDDKKLRRSGSRDRRSEHRRDGNLKRGGGWMDKRDEDRQKDRRYGKDRSHSPARPSDKRKSRSPSHGGSHGSPANERRGSSPKRSKRSPERRRGSRERNMGGRPQFDKKPSKLSILERLGITLPNVTDLQGAVTPQQLIQRSMALQVQQVKSTTGIELPSYYNPAAMNPARYADQIQKRRLLWGNKNEGATAKPAEAAPVQAQPAAGANKWEGTTFKSDHDGMMTAKFKRLMGIKNQDLNTGEGSSGTGNKPVEGNEIIKKQEEMFNSMEMQYEVARVATHTHRGLGLGFGTFQYPR